jgi:hypothetical protein
MSAALLAELKRLMTYDPLTGEFTRIIDHSSRAKAGSIAGSIISDGYRQICIFSKVYRAHRLAWLYTYGYTPTETVDHKNRIHSDNRLDNLRLATKSRTPRTSNSAKITQVVSRALTGDRTFRNGSRRFNTTKNIITLGSSPE